MNRFTFESFGRSAAVTLMYDPRRDCIGLKPSFPLISNAFPVKEKGKSFLV